MISENERGKLRRWLEREPRRVALKPQEVLDLLDDLDKCHRALEWIERHAEEARTPGYGPNPCNGIVLVARAMSESRQ